MFSILRDQQSFKIKHWNRWTDGCGAQFKSRFVNIDLLKVKEVFDLESVTYSYFEAHEGKNVSDTTGSIVKCAFLKAIAKENEGISNSKDVVRLIKEATKLQTPKFDFFLVDEFPFVERIPEKERDSFIINGITKLHHLVVKDNGILADETPCVNCCPDMLCEECDKKDVYYDAEEIYNEKDSDIDENMVVGEDGEDVGKSKEWNSGDSDNEGTLAAPGDIVWARYGRCFYPAKIISYSGLPSNLQSGLFRKKKSESVIVKWYGESNFSWVRLKNIDELAENKIDNARASMNKSMQQTYQLALADLRNE